MIACQSLRAPEGTVDGSPDVDRETQEVRETRTLRIAEPPGAAGPDPGVSGRRSGIGPGWIPAVVGGSGGGRSGIEEGGSEERGAAAPQPPPVAEPRPMDPLVGEFLDSLRAGGRAWKTVESYRSDWAGFDEWHRAEKGAPPEAKQLDGERVRAYLHHLDEAGMRPSTVNRKLVFLKRLASWAHGQGALDATPHAEVRGVEAVRQEARRPRGLSELDLRRFLREVERRASARDTAIVYTFLATGLKVSELIALRREHVDLSRRRAVIEVMGKRGRRRTIGLEAGARQHLAAYLAARGPEPGALFVGERGPLTANAVQRVVRKYCEFAKVAVSPVTLRHTFAATFLTSTEDDLVALADVLGHECLETTRLYLAARDGGDPSAGDPTEGTPRAPAVLPPRVGPRLDSGRGGAPPRGEATVGASSGASVGSASPRLRLAVPPPEVVA